MKTKDAEEMLNQIRNIFCENDDDIRDLIHELSVSVGLLEQQQGDVWSNDLVDMIDELHAEMKEMRDEIKKMRDEIHVEVQAS